MPEEFYSRLAAPINRKTYQSDSDAVNTDTETIHTKQHHRHNDDKRSNKGNTASIQRKPLDMYLTGNYNISSKSNSAGIPNQADQDAATSLLGFFDHLKKESNSDLVNFAQNVHIAQASSFQVSNEMSSIRPIDNSHDKKQKRQQDNSADGVAADSYLSKSDSKVKISFRNPFGHSI
jgi:hypothetical protein